MLWGDSCSHGDSDKNHNDDAEGMGAPLTLFHSTLSESR